MTRVRIRLLWYKQAQFAGYLLAEQLGLGRDKGVEIVCEGLDFSSKHVAAVLTGAAEMCVASPAHILESRAPSELRFLLAVQQASPLVYPVRASSGIETLDDLSGRSVAVWPGHEDLELRWMLEGAGVPDAAVRRIEMPDTVTPFLAGEVACAQMTTYHELHQVEDALGATAIRCFSARDSGRDLLKDGLVAGRRFVEDRADVVQAVVDAVLEGWTIAFSDAETAVAACLTARPDVSAAEHRSQLAAIRDLALQGPTLTDGLGVPHESHMARAAAAIAAVEGRSVDTAGILDRRFFDRAPARFRGRDWA
jgi:ABC-type nitrate/sulfonate/bicarbonate transport system substrate-binding protein